MSSVLIVAGLWGLFFATHVGLATRPVRGPLVARLGERGFTLLFSAVAAVCFSAVVATYASLRGDGPAGLDLGRGAAARPLLYGVVALGFLLMAPALWRYPASNYAVGREAVRAPRGLDRITRHPFFVGLALVGLAHAALATRLVGAVFMTGIATVALVGAWHQDRKLLRSKGDAYAEFVAATSLLPFAAILSGRQRLVAAELPWSGFAVGALACVLLRVLHDGLFAYYGAALIAGTVGGAAVFLATSRRRRAGAAGDASEAAGTVPLALLFTLTGVAHAAVGLWLFADPLADIVRAGVVNGIVAEPMPGAPASLLALEPLYDREAAFWFLLLSPVLILLARLVDHAQRGRDATLLAVIGRYLVGIGIVGVLMMPISGFWIVLVLGVLVRRRSRRLGDPGTRPGAPPSADLQVAPV